MKFNIRKSNNRFLVISDLQIPFENSKALLFIIHLAKEFKIPLENILNVGDETDQYFGGLYKHSIDALHTANQELDETIDKLKLWYDAFPYMKLCISNHGVRWWKKAFESDIPIRLLKKYEEVIEAPKTWVWQHEWRFTNIRYPFRMIHGMGYSGVHAHRVAAIDGGISTVIGHLHSSPGIDHIRTSGLNIWGMNSGCLIDTEAYAFFYNKDHRFKPGLGASVILDDGKTPIWVPLE